MGLFEMGITFVTWLKALQLSRTTAQVSNLVYASPFLSLFLIHFIVGEEIFPSTIVGLVLIVAGVALSTVRKPKERGVLKGSFEEIRRILLKNVVALVGFADMTAVPADDRKDMDGALSIAVALEPGIIARIAKGPTKEYFREYKRVNVLLSKLSRLAAKLLKERGFSAVALEPTTEEFDAVRLRAGLSHKIAATRSGLGWIGEERPRDHKVLRFGDPAYDGPHRRPLERGHPFDESNFWTCSAVPHSVPRRPPRGRTGAGGSTGTLSSTPRPAAGRRRNSAKRKGLIDDLRHLHRGLPMDKEVHKGFLRAGINLAVTDLDWRWKESFLPRATVEA